MFKEKYPGYVIEGISEQTYKVYKVEIRPRQKKLQEGKSINPEEDRDRLKNVPKEFRKFIRLFRREEEVRLLLRSRWDHVIELKLGTQLGYFKIYPINEKEREILRKYIKKNLEIGKIRRSKSKIEYLIFFIIKKDRGRRPYINYR